MDIERIYNIIDQLAKDGLIFSNEQDFQFEFAKALSMEHDVEKVKLEALSIKKTWDSIKENVDAIKRTDKEYTDIVLRTKNGECIAIELKFKTPNKICYYKNKKHGDVFTMAQGAYNINAYDYLQDVSRLENIKYRCFSDINTIDKGYAILLTNDFHYRFYDFAKSIIWNNYNLIDKRKIDPGELLFNGNQKSNKTKNRKFQAIVLKNEYQIEWRDYPLSEYTDYEDKVKNQPPGFSYLVLEVKPEEVGES